jgi:hypothetical protein
MAYIPGGQTNLYLIPCLWHHITEGCRHRKLCSCSMTPLACRKLYSLMNNIAVTRHLDSGLGIRCINLFRWYLLRIKSFTSGEDALEYALSQQTSLCSSSCAFLIDICPIGMFNAAVAHLGVRSIAQIGTSMACSLPGSECTAMWR